MVQTITLREASWNFEASKHHPCVKSAWVEYLGEHPEPAIDRVQ